MKEKNQSHHSGSVFHGILSRGLSPSAGPVGSPPPAVLPSAAAARDASLCVPHWTCPVAVSSRKEFSPLFFTQSNGKRFIALGKTASFLPGGLKSGGGARPGPSAPCQP